MKKVKLFFTALVLTLAISGAFVSNAIAPDYGIDLTVTPPVCVLGTVLQVPIACSAFNIGQPCTLILSTNGLIAPAFEDRIDANVCANALRQVPQ